jgi:hypothetical protein
VFRARDRSPRWSEALGQSLFADFARRRAPVDVPVHTHPRAGTNPAPQADDALVTSVLDLHNGEPQHHPRPQQDTAERRFSKPVPSTYDVKASHAPDRTRDTDQDSLVHGLHELSGTRHLPRSA